MGQGGAEVVGYEVVEPFHNILERGTGKQELLVAYNMKDQPLHTEEIPGNISEIVCDEMVHTDDM